MRVLVADDEMTCREVLSEFLREEGYEPVVARDGNEAWNILQSPSSPNLVFLDWNMPGMDGPDVCRRLRRREGGNHVYVVMLTAQEGEGAMQAAFEVGVNDYVRKAAPLSEFRSRLCGAHRFLAVCEELAALRAAMENQSSYDLLTGLEKRAGVLDQLEKVAAHARRRQAPLALLMIELDHMVSIREIYGPRVGDALLAEVARRITGTVRPYDIAGRYEDHRFLVVAPDCQAEAAAVLAERIRDLVAKETFCIKGKTVAATASVGFVSAVQAEGDDMGSLVGAVVAAAAEASKAGGNRAAGAQAMAQPVETAGSR